MEEPIAGAKTAASWRLRRFVPLLVLGAGFGAFFAFGLEHQLTLAALKEHRTDLLVYVSGHPWLSALEFVAAYTLAVAFSLPIATLLTLAGGFLFGTLMGGALTVLGATLGATAIFLAAKTALADILEERFGSRLKPMEDGFRKNAFNYLLALRLIPAFPFFLVNLAAGLLGVRPGTYVAATFIGIMPATFVYAGLGNGLGKIFDSGRTPDLRIILRPEILAPLVGLAVLAVLPVLWRALSASKRK